MRKQAIIAIYNRLVEELKEDPRDVVLSSGAALVLLDIRTHAQKLHVDVAPGVYSWAKTKFGVYHPKGIDEMVHYNRHVDLHEFSENTGRICVDGIWMYSQNELAKQKRFLLTIENRNPDRRIQDQQELDLLKAMMASPVRHTARMA